jgi:hypothetical protein
VLLVDMAAVVLVLLVVLLITAVIFWASTVRRPVTGTGVGVSPRIPITDGGRSSVLVATAANAVTTAEKELLS